MDTPTWEREQRQRAGGRGRGLVASSCTHFSPQGPFTKPCWPQLALRLHQGLGLAVTHPHPPVSEQDSEWATWPAGATRSPVPHDLSSPLRRPHSIWVQRKGLSLLLAEERWGRAAVEAGGGRKGEAGVGGLPAVRTGRSSAPRSLWQFPATWLVPHPQGLQGPHSPGQPCKEKLERGCDGKGCDGNGCDGSIGTPSLRVEGGELGAGWGRSHRHPHPTPRTEPS